MGLYSLFYITLLCLGWFKNGKTGQLKCSGTQQAGIAELTDGAVGSWLILQRQLDMFKSTVMLG